jgi:hypothetical protein
MFYCYVGGYDCSADVIREEGWKCEAIFATLREAFDYCEEHACYDDTGWIEHDGDIRQFFDWEL